MGDKSGFVRPSELQSVDVCLTHRARHHIRALEDKARVMHDAHAFLLFGHGILDRLNLNLRDVAGASGTALAVEMKLERQELKGEYVGDGGDDDLERHTALLAGGDSNQC